PCVIKPESSFELIPFKEVHHGMTAMSPKRRSRRVVAVNGRCPVVVCEDIPCGGPIQQEHDSKVINDIVFKEVCRSPIPDHDCVPTSTSNVTLMEDAAPHG